MNSNKTVSYLVLTIGILVIGLAGCIGYIMGNSKTDTTGQKTSITSDEKVMEEIEELKAMYDAKIKEKTTSFSELKTEKERVKKLVFELEKTKNNAQSLLKYKTQYQQLESKMKTLVDEIVILKSKKTQVLPATIVKTKPKAVKPLVDNNNKSINALPVAQKKVVKQQLEQKQIVPPKESIPNNTSIKTVGEQNKSKTTVEKTEPKEQPTKVESFVYENVTLSEVTSGGFDIKTASKVEKVNSASKVDVIKVSFTIDQNARVKQESKRLLIQVIDAKNNVMGKKITEFFDGKTLTYSYSKTIDYTGDILKISQDITALNYDKGTYFVNIFDGSRLIGKSSFTLN